MAQAGDRSQERGRGPEVAVKPQGLAREVQRVSKLRSGALLTLDLLLVDPIYADIWAHRECVEWEGTSLWVVSRDGLVQMKRLAGRLQDLADIEKLEAPDEDA